MHDKSGLHLEHSSTEDESTFIPDAYNCIICRKNFLVAKQVYFNVEEICPDCGSAMMARMQLGEELDVTMERTSEVMLHLQEAGATNSTVFFDDPIMVHVMDSENASEEIELNQEEDEQNIAVLDLESSENKWIDSS